MLKNRKPQSAGSTAYCSNCLVEKIDKDVKELRDTIQNSNPRQVKYQSAKTPVPVRFATIFNKDEKPVCRVDLLKHPNLMPNFAKPTQQMVHQENQSKRELASTESEEPDLPPCSDKYLSILKKVAKNNVVLNSDKPFVHKVDLRTKLIALVAGCTVGLGTSLTTDVDPRIGAITSGSAAIGSSVMALSEAGEEMRTFQKLNQPGINQNEQNKLIKKANKLKKNRLFQSAIYGSAVCYLGTEIVTYTK